MLCGFNCLILEYHKKLKMNNLSTPLKSGSPYYHLKDNRLVKVIVPDLLFRSFNSNIALASGNITYFSKDGDHSIVHCLDIKPIHIECSIEQITLRFSNIPMFQSISDSLIININHIDFISENMSTLSVLNSEYLTYDNVDMDSIFANHLVL